MKSNVVPQPAVCNLKGDVALASVLDRLLRYARSRLRNEAMAEDAVSEMLLAAVEANLDVDSPARTTAWVFGVLKHKLVDQLRTQQREQPAGDLTAEREQATFMPGTDLPDAGGPGHGHRADVRVLGVTHGHLWGHDAPRAPAPASGVDAPWRHARRLTLGPWPQPRRRGKVVGRQDLLAPRAT